MRIKKRILRRMGYASYCQGIIDQYINVNGAWDDHLSNTRKFILKTIQGKKINNLAIYGSGWMLDLPLEELSSLVRHIWLFDIIHPSQIIHKISKYGNVTAESVDITGGALYATYEAVKKYKKTGTNPDIHDLCNKSFQWPVSFDYAVSLNILSQLGEMVTGYLKKNTPADPEDRHAIIGLLQQSHLKLLVPGKSCLVTDIEELGYDAENHISYSKDLIHCPFPLQRVSETWEWQFDPLKEYNPGLKTVLKVVAAEL